MSHSGCSKLALIGLAVVLLPVFIGATSTFLFCRSLSPGTSWSGGGRPAEVATPEGCGGGRETACGAVVQAFAAADRSDSEALRALLSDPAWLERLPPAATTSASDQGRYYVRMLLDEPPASLEELRDPSPWEVVPAGIQTELDGQTAWVTLRVRVGEGVSREIPAQARRTTEGWKLVPPAR